MNLYRFVGNACAHFSDFLGMFTVSFHAFIHKDLGQEIRYLENIGDEVTAGRYFFQEPGHSGWYAATDNRGFGGGNSRIQSQSVNILISDIGKMEGKTWFKTEVGASTRIQKQLLFGNGNPPYLVALERKTAKDLECKEVAHDTGPDSSEVTVKASASYPFIFAPDIDYEVTFSFCRMDESTVIVSVKGSHNKFPCYEALVNGSDHIWKYDAKAEGYSEPGLYNLNSTYDFQGWKKEVRE